MRLGRFVAFHGHSPRLGSEYPDVRMPQRFSSSASDRLRHRTSTLPRALPHRDESGYEYGYERELDFDLLVSQRNELYTIVEEERFAPSAFEWYATGGAFFGSDGTTVPMVVHKPTGFFCKFGFLDESTYREVGYNSGGSFHGEFFLQRAPAEAKARDVLLWSSWDEVKVGFSEWLGYVKRESTQPDYWVVAPPSGILPAIAPDASNELFNASERDRIATALDEIKREMHDRAELTEAQLAGLTATLDDVRESANRLGRRDWLNGLLGAYVGWAMNATLSSGIAQSIFDLIASKLAWLWTELPKLLR